MNPECFTVLSSVSYSNKCNPTACSTVFMSDFIRTSFAFSFSPIKLEAASKTKMAKIAITTKTSMSVNPLLRLLFISINSFINYNILIIPTILLCIYIKKALASSVFKVNCRVLKKQKKECFCEQ